MVLWHLLRAVKLSSVGVNPIQVVPANQSAFDVVTGAGRSLICMPVLRLLLVGGEEIAVDGEGLCFPHPQAFLDQEFK